MGWNRVSRAGLVRRLAAALVAGSVLSAAGCAYLDVKQREWIFRAQRDVAAMPSDYGLKYEEVWLTVPGDREGARERVYAWWIPGPDAQAPALLYLHGARWSLSNNLFRIQRLQRMGFAVLAIDYRGFGKSDGDLPSEQMAYEDARAAWQWLIARQPDPKRRFIYGHSLGGAVAIDLAASVAPTGPHARGLVERLGEARRNEAIGFSVHDEHGNPDGLDLPDRIELL